MTRVTHGRALDAGLRGRPAIGSDRLD